MSATPRFVYQNFLKIGDADVAPLNAELAAHPELWGQYGWRKEAPGSPHAQMTDVWVRYNDVRPFLAKGSMAGFNDEHEGVWYPAYEKLPALKDIIYPLMREVEGERIGAVLITKIPPGQGIAKHRDASWHVEHYDKFYVSMQSAPGALFCSGTDALNPAPGEVWRFDNRREHWVENNSSEDRVTLIICIRTRKYDASGHVSVA